MKSVSRVAKVSDDGFGGSCEHVSGVEHTESDRIRACCSCACASYVYVIRKRS